MKKNALNQKLYKLVLEYCNENGTNQFEKTNILLFITL